MHRIVLALGLMACGPDLFDCADEGACQLVEERYQIADHPVIGRQSVVFGATSLVHFEYGAANDCPSGCYYSHYCAFVANGEEYPLMFSFTSEAERLFDPTQYCSYEQPPLFGGDSSPSACAMPGYELPIVASPSFRSWVQDPDDVNDEFRWCRNELAFAYSIGAI
jgi:hypothetical protein